MWILSNAPVGAATSLVKGGNEETLMSRLLLLIHDLFDISPIGKATGDALWDVNGLSRCGAWKKIAKSARFIWPDSSGCFLRQPSSRSRIRFAKEFNAE